MKERGVLRYGPKGEEEEEQESSEEQDQLYISLDSRTI